MNSFSKKWNTIVKYNPIYFTGNGIYSNIEWTHIYDVGKVFHGKTFTLEEYINTENKYINTILKIMDLLGNPILKITYIEKSNSILDQLIATKDRINNMWLLEKAKTLKRGSYISIRDLPDIIRIGLRYACLRLYNREKKLLIKFGDYCYVYLYTDLSKIELYKIVSEQGLFLNPNIF